MDLELAVDPLLTDELRAEIVACWTDVTNAGGAVGFVAPVTMDEVLPVARMSFAGVDAGRDRLITARAPALGGGRRLAALAFITGEQFVLTEHWRTVKRVMVHPDCQGLGHGTRLMSEIERVGREMGLEQLVLDCRDGTGADAFYKKCGYTEYGRHRSGLRLSAGEYRDRISMALQL
jgi:GNAT superfamily N-acetyltransferase